MRELKRCPFCGGEAKLCKGYWIGKEYWVECTNCTCKTSLSNNYNEPIRVWNTRKPLKRIVERLEEVAFVDIDETYADDAQQMLFLYDAIEIVKEEGRMNE